MKRIEKMILCCIWICIAIVAVLIKDQIDLKQKIVVQSIKKMDEVQEKSETVVLNESEVMELVASSLPAMSEASLAFTDDGQIQMNVTVSDSMIAEAERIINHEAVSVFLPFRLIGEHYARVVFLYQSEPYHDNLVHLLCVIIYSHFQQLLLFFL